MSKQVIQTITKEGFFYRKSGKFHRDDGPANGPAIEKANGEILY